MRRAARRLAAAWLFSALLASGLPTARAQELPGRSVPDEGASHAPEGTPLTFAHYPPASGTHYPRWARYAFFEEPVLEGYWVHNLEHGSVVILYRCDEACASRVAELRAVYDSLPPSRWGHVKALALPYDRMNSAVAVVAWARIDEMDAVDPERILRFYQNFVDRGPEDVP